jgi:hypothetical protein
MIGLAFALVGSTSKKKPAALAPGLIPVPMPDGRYWLVEETTPVILNDQQANTNPNRARQFVVYTPQQVRVLRFEAIGENLKNAIQRYPGVSATVFNRALKDFAVTDSMKLGG